MATIHFYQAAYIDVKKVVKAKSKKTKIVETKVNFDIFEQEFKEIIANNVDDENCILLEENPDWRLLEIIGLGKFIKGKELYEYSTDMLEECDFIFGRLGRKKEISGVQRRHRETHTAKGIEKAEQEDIEIYTYFYIFFEKAKQNRVVTIAYLSGQSAPTIRLLSNLIIKYGDKDNKRLLVSPIITKDVVGILKKKDILNSFSYKVSVPSDRVLRELGLSEDAFDNFRNLNYADIEITIGGNRNKDILENKDFLYELVQKIPNHRKKHEKKISFKAKNENEQLAEYKYIDDKVVRKVEFEYQTTDNPDARQNEIKDKLFEIYKQNRNTLLEFVRE